MLKKENKKKRDGYIYKKIDFVFALLGSFVYNIWRYINTEITKLAEVYFDAKEKSKDLVGTNLKVAESHIKNNNLFDAILRYKIVLRMQKNNFEALYGLGFLYSQLGEFKKALKYLEISKDYAPNEELLTEVERNIEKAEQRMQK